MHTCVKCGEERHVRLASGLCVGCWQKNIMTGVNNFVDDLRAQGFTVKVNVGEIRIEVEEVDDETGGDDDA